KDEKPERRVSLAAFEIGQFPVTRAEFSLFLLAGGYGNERWWDTSAAKAWRSGKGAVNEFFASWKDRYRTLQGRSEESLREMVEQSRATSEDVEHWLWLRSLSEEKLEEILRAHFFLYPSTCSASRAAGTIRVIAIRRNR